jgi:hypothetical protein
VQRFDRCGVRGQAAGWCIGVRHPRSIGIKEVGARSRGERCRARDGRRPSVRDDLGVADPSPRRQPISQARRPSCPCTRICSSPTPPARR